MFYVFKFFRIYPYRNKQFHCVRLFNVLKRTIIGQCRTYEQHIHYTLQKLCGAVSTNAGGTKKTSHARTGYILLKCAC